MYNLRSRSNSKRTYNLKLSPYETQIIVSNTDEF